VKKKRGGTCGTCHKYCQEMPGVVHDIYFLEKMNRYPSTNKQSLPEVDMTRWGCKGIGKRHHIYRTTRHRGSILFSDISVHFWGFYDSKTPR
jgi:hypothetical protein